MWSQTPQDVGPPGAGLDTLDLDVVAEQSRESLRELVDIVTDNQEELVPIIVPF